VERLSVWMGVGVVSAGVSAALLSGAGPAGADTGSGSDPGGTSSAASTGSDPSASERKRGSKDRAAGSPRKHRSESVKDKDSKDTKSSKDTEPAKDSDDGKDSKDGKDTEDSKSPGAEPNSTAGVASDVADTDTDKPESAVRTTGDRRDRTPKHPASGNLTTKPTPTSEPEPEPEPEPAVTAAADESTTDIAVAPELAPKRIAAQDVSVKLAAPASPPTTSVSAIAPPAPPTALDVIGGLISAVVVNVGSLVFNTLQAVEALVTGPPVVPPGSAVTVRSSTVQLGNGQRVAANWFYPSGDTPPTDMILLQHGFLALGPMYSYTAANLAAETHSVVVTTTLSSNPFVGDSFWLGAPACPQRSRTCSSATARRSPPARSMPGTPPGMAWTRRPRSCRSGSRWPATPLVRTWSRVRPASSSTRAPPTIWSG
jgi:hypothetical protein